MGNTPREPKVGSRLDPTPPGGGWWAACDTQSVETYAYQNGGWCCYVETSGAMDQTPGIAVIAIAALARLRPLEFSTTDYLPSYDSEQPDVAGDPVRDS